MARSQLPSTNPIIVPGPGPTEIQAAASPDVPVPPSKTDAPITLVDPSSAPPVSTTPNDASSDLDEEDDDAVPSGQTNTLDPYSNLDNAFGSYLADEPRPMTSGRHGDEDDLLF